MATLLQQRTLKNVVLQYASNLGLPESKAFLYFVIEQYLAFLNLNEIDIEESIIDGSNDCGIDAIVIDEDSEDYPQIYFFQSKYYQKENAFEVTFEGGALDRRYAPHSMISY